MVQDAVDFNSYIHFRGREGKGRNGKGREGKGREGDRRELVHPGINVCIINVCMYVCMYVLIK